MNRFQMIFRRILNRPAVPAPVKVRDGEGPQINGGPGPQVLPGAGKPSPYDQPQVQPGAGDGFFSRPQVLGLGGRVERPYSSRPFGAAQDDQLF